MKISLRQILVKLPPEGRLLFELPSFEVSPGKKILIEGGSGKGKTTFLHLIAGLFYPASGVVEIGDARMDRMSDDERCRFRRSHIAMIFQKLNLIEHLTALENVRLATPRSSQASSGQIGAEEALRRVGLGDRANQRSSLMSLGEQQRVAVARVLAANSEIILADEPTSSLDAANAANVMDLLFSAACDKTMIVVSHDLRIGSRFDVVTRFEDIIRI